MNEHAAEKDAHGATLHGDRVICTCGDFNCASLSYTGEWEIRAHRMNACVRCRDWGQYERHEDHSPPRVTPSARKG